MPNLAGFPSKPARFSSDYLRFTTYKLDFCLFSAEFQAIIEFFAKKRQNTANAWQIASLVALARNDSLFKEILNVNVLY